MVKVSVVTVVFNDGAGLRRTLDSVLEQERVVLEPIVIDGGSVDSTREVMQRYSSGLAKWVSEPDEGIFHAMDKGLSLATGDWVIFMNAGDCFASKSVLSQLELDSAGEYAIVYGSKEQGGRRIDPLPVGPATYAGVIFACHQSMLFNRRRLGSALHYHQACQIYGDFELVARLFKEGFRFLKKDLIVARFEGGGISARVSWQKRLEKYRILWMYFGWTGTILGFWNRLVRRW